MAGPASAPSPRSVLLVVAAAVLGIVVLFLAIGLAFEAVFPTNDDIVVQNDTGAEITDVRLLEGYSTDYDEVAQFDRIGPNASALAEDAGTGRFSLEYSDSRGRWIAPRVISRDDDDIRFNGAPQVIVVSDGRVGDVPVTPRR